MVLLTPTKQFNKYNNNLNIKYNYYYMFKHLFSNGFIFISGVISGANIHYLYLNQDKISAITGRFPPRSV